MPTLVNGHDEDGRLYGAFPSSSRSDGGGAFSSSPHAAGGGMGAMGAGMNYHQFHRGHHDGSDNEMFDRTGLMASQLFDTMVGLYRVNPVDP